MRGWLSILCLVLLLPLVVSAEEAVVAHSPVDGASINPASDRFTFSLSSELWTIPIESCTLHVGETTKKMVLNDVFGGGSRSFTTDVEDGEYSWHISCVTSAGAEYATPARTILIVREAPSEVKATNSGVTKGSLRYEFTLKDAPITVQKIAPGDSIKININVAPSTRSSEFYVKRKSAIDGKDFLLLTLKGEEFTLPEGEDVALPVASTTVYAHVDSFEASRATITFTRKAGTSEEQTPQETEEEEPVDEVVEPEPQLDEPDEEETPTPPVEPTPEPPSPPPAPSDDDAPRQGFFSWILSLLARAFGT